MPEYLAPGVYVEEVSFRSKSIEGVSTSVAGFVGPTRFGPTGGDSELVTSFPEFGRIFGGLDKLVFQDPADDTASLPPWDNYMAHAVRAFFDNGGTKLFISRIYEPSEDIDPNDEVTDLDDDNRGKAFAEIGSPPAITLRARFPGVAGNLRVVFSVVASPNRLIGSAGNAALRGLTRHDVVYLRRIDNTAAAPAGFYDAEQLEDESWVLRNGGGDTAISSLDPAVVGAHIITLNATAKGPGRFDDEEAWDGLQLHPQGRSSLTRTFAVRPESRRQYLETPLVIEHELTTGFAVLQALVPTNVLDLVELNLRSDRDLRTMSPPAERPAASQLRVTFNLAGGDDGRIPTPATYHGVEIGQAKTGLLAFEDVDEISIVAAPGSSAKYGSPDQLTDARSAQIVQELDIHCHRMGYRVSVLDARDNQVLSEVRDYRGGFDSTHAAFYYPWVTTIDPLDPDGRREINLPPSGYVAGIYARSDVLHGVFKAPANEVVLGAIGFETLLNKAQQDILNPSGVNCFRFFEGRGYRLWGARTISSDPEWKYISVRRYFAYLEHSIDKGTQWAVFENNGPSLWANVTQTVHDFLVNEWRNGALLGNKPEEAFFVRCDRSTMTQNDLDNGRLVCLIGVAVVKPAEFVIFRIGQMTADGRR